MRTVIISLLTHFRNFIPLIRIFFLILIIYGSHCHRIFFLPFFCSQHFHLNRSERSHKWNVWNCSVWPPRVKFSIWQLEIKNLFIKIMTRSAHSRSRTIHICVRVWLFHELNFIICGPNEIWVKWVEPFNDQLCSKYERGI